MRVELPAYPDDCIPFMEGLFTVPVSETDRPHLIGSKCQLCGRIDFPRRTFCIQCLREDCIKDIQLSRIGKIYAFTIMRWQKLAPQGHTVPYAFGFVDLPEKVRILTKIHADDLDNIKTDKNAELEILEIDRENDKKVLGFCFKVIP